MTQKHTFFRKIFSGYLIIILFLVLIISLISYRIIRQHYIKTLSDNLEKIAFTLRPGFKELIRQNKIDQIDERAKNIAQNINQGRKLGIRITIVAPDGVVYGDSEEDPQDMENHKTESRGEIMSVFEDNKPGQSIRYSSTLNREMLYIAIPVKYNGEIISVIRTSLFLE